MEILDLFELLKAGEGPHTEFKREFPEQSHDLAKGMVALANGGGGILILGVEDGGRVVGIADPERAVERLAGIARSTSPPLLPEIDMLRFGEGRTVVYARVTAGGPYMYKGKVYVRVGSTNHEATGGDELRALLGSKPSTPVPQKRVSSAVFDPPPVRAFKGRDTEVSLFDRYLNLTPSTARVLAIEGMSGIGKTALAAHFAERARAAGYSVFWYECREDTSVDALGAVLRLFAQSVENLRLADALDDVGLPPEERGLRVAAAIADQKCVLLFDDYHLVVDRLLDRLLVRVAERAVATRVVIMCRQRPRLMTALSPILTVELQLRAGLEPEAARQFLAECGLDLLPSQANGVWQLTGEGHPKALEIFAARARTFPVEDLVATLPVFREDLRVEWLRPLIDELPPDQRELAIDLSVFDRSIPEAASAQLFPSREVVSSVAGLVDRFLLDRAAGQRLNMHMLVREVCYDEITDKATKHRWAAGYYAGIRSAGASGELWTEAAIEAGAATWYHLLKAGELESAREELARLRPQLMHRGEYERLMFFLERTPVTDVDTEWHTIHKARILSIWGDSETALALLSPLLTSVNSDIQREAVLVTATIHTDDNHPDLAKRLLDGMREQFLASGTVLVRRRFLSRLIEVQLRLGDSKKALEWAGKLCQLCEIEGDEIAGAIALRQMASVLQCEGQLPGARSLTETSCELLTRHGRMRDAAVSETMLARVCADLNDMPSARHHVESALATFLGIGDNRNALLCREQRAALLRGADSHRHRSVEVDPQ